MHRIWALKCGTVMCMLEWQLCHSDAGDPRPLAHEKKNQNQRLASSYKLLHVPVILCIYMSTTLHLDTHL